MGDEQVSLERIDERVEQLGNSMNQMNSRVGRFESQVNDRFGRFESQVDDRFGRFESQVNDRFDRVESGISQIQNQFRDLQQTLVQMTWGLAAALLVVLGAVITAQL
jgi:chaperonin cofactor prefoldin